ncbi:MAG: hypothetical protein KDE27_13880, partial [Planctomycetes bacterium]|nr:hypothetical protein [Planctomycetota bacterium]
TAWSALGAGVDNWVTALHVRPNGDLVVSGNFSTAGGQPAYRVARWNGASWQSMGTLGEAHAFVELANGELFAGGKFYGYTATWDGTGWQTLGGDLNYWVEAVAELPNGDLFAGGSYSSNSGEYFGIGSWDGSAWAPFGLGKGLGGAVTAVAAGPAGSFVVGGWFQNVPGGPAPHIARYDGVTDTWSALGSGLGGKPYALAVAGDGDVVAGGEFTTAGGAAASRIARWDGASWSGLGQGVDGSVRALVELPNGDLVAGGEFLNAGGAFHPFVARWDGAAWHGLGTGTTWYVRALAVLPNGDVVAGGGFTTAGGVSCRRIARWNGTSWSPLGSGMDYWVHALLVLPNGDLIAGGDFDVAGGVAARNIARWDGSTWSTVAADTLGGGEVMALAVTHRGELAAGGSIGTSDAVYFARLGSTCPAAADPIATGCVGPAGPIELTAGNWPWTGSTFHSHATGFATNALGVALLGLSSPNVSLTWLWPNTAPGCDQLASQEAIVLTLPQNGETGYAFEIPNDPAFAGLPLYHQFLQFELDPQGNLATLSASNGLSLTIGTL